MSEMDYEKLREIWAGRAGGAFGAVGAIYGFWNGISDSLWTALKGAIGAGFTVGFIAYMVVLIVIIAFGEVFSEASEQANPILQGIRFIVVLLGMFILVGAAVGAALLGG